MFALVLLPVLLGTVVAWGGVRGVRRGLTRERGVGVRTTATLRSDDAFRLGNAVAGPPTIAGGAVAAAGGGAAFVMPSATGAIVAVTLGVLGMLVLVAGGGVLGHRAAATVPAPASEAGPCDGCAAICGPSEVSADTSACSTGAGAGE